MVIEGGIVVPGMMIQNKVAPVPYSRERERERCGAQSMLRAISVKGRVASSHPPSKNASSYGRKRDV